jgi:SAM-dependent methyltransferase
LRNYNKDFYNTMESGSITSANELVPLLISRYSPDSIVDVGCGTGAFANEFLNRGISDVIGYEGEWMKKLPTILPRHLYVYEDITSPFITSRKYDLCLCLEVAEHLLEEHANTLIETLTGLSDVVVFSAAIPNQGGNHHVNEQWPIYWSELFAAKGYYLEWDPRSDIWENSKIEACYRQNLLVFSSKIKNVHFAPVSLVHPDLWSAAMSFRKIPVFNRIIRRLPKSVFRLRRFLMRVLRRV